MKNNYSNYILLTISITSVIFLFLIFLIYVIYCYGYYDKSIQEKIIENYNSYKFDYLYEHTKKDDIYLTRDIYNNVISLTYNRNNLLKIYESYYKNLYSKEEFLNKYYYGNKILKKESFSFSKENKTTLFKRANIYVDNIYIFNDDNNKTTYGIINNITFNIKKDSNILLDNQKLSCTDICNINKIYGGIHSIKYNIDGFTYFGLVNINEDNQIININDYEDLIMVEKEGSMELLQ